MRLRGVVAALAVGAVALGIAAYALAGGAGFNHLSETLISYQEVPSVSSVGTATFTADVNDAGDAITWEVSYRDLESPIQQSHIHFGQRSVNGGISVFLCTNLGNGPPGMQGCPTGEEATTGSYHGVITAADVSPNIAATAAARAQGINTGEFNELVRAMEAGKTYVNIHTTMWPGGEIRAQINETGNPHD